MNKGKVLLEDYIKETSEGLRQWGMVSAQEREAGITMYFCLEERLEASNQDSQ